MSDEPASKMIRVSTPLIAAVQKLCQLHRAGHTQAIIQGLEQLISGVEGQMISTDIGASSPVLERLSTLEADIRLIQQRLNLLESSNQSGKGDEEDEEVDITVDSDVDSNTIAAVDSSLAESDPEVDISDSNTDINSSERLDGVNKDADINTDINQATVPKSLSQVGLGKRLGVSDNAVKKQRLMGTKRFALWSQEKDPDGIAWGFRGSGKQLVYFPKRELR